jgi:Tfp pilus assembly major pilin PilA
MLSRKNQIGDSLIEMLGVLGIMSVITVLSITAYEKARQKLGKSESYQLERTTSTKCDEVSYSIVDANCKISEYNITKEQIDNCIKNELQKDLFQGLEYETIRCVDKIALKIEQEKLKKEYGVEDKVIETESSVDVNTDYNW